MEGNRTIFLDKLPPRVLDITGYISGRLTILRIHSTEIYPKGGRAIRWVARCSCGNETIVSGHHFRNGDLKSCGCLGKERLAIEKHMRPAVKSKHPTALPRPFAIDLNTLWRRKFKNYTDQRVGKLTAIKPVKAVKYFLHDSRTGKVTSKLVVYWRCLCDCGSFEDRNNIYLGNKKANHGCQRCRFTERNKKNNRDRSCQNVYDEV